MPHAKSYKRSPDHARVPNKAIWNIAPHCETTNQQDCLSDSTSELCSGILVVRKMESKTSHIPSLITALPNLVFNNQTFVRRNLHSVKLSPVLTTPIKADCLRREEQIDEPKVSRFCRYTIDYRNTLSHWIESVTRFLLFEKSTRPLRLFPPDRCIHIHRSDLLSFAATRSLTLLEHRRL